MSDKKILKVKDIFDSQMVKKNNLPNLPFRSLIIGKSQLSGKSNLMVNLLARPEFYGNDFKGENIYIFSNSLKTDEKIKKLIKFKEIPDENCFSKFDDEMIGDLLDIIKEDYIEEMEKKKPKPEHKIIILDDVSFSRDVKKSEELNRCVSNARHYLCSILLSAQRITQINPVVRSNASSAYIFSQSNKDLELVNDDFNYLFEAKTFKKMFKEITKQPHHFMGIVLDNPPPLMYMDCFEKMDYEV